MSLTNFCAVHLEFYGVRNPISCVRIATSAEKVQTIKVRHLEVDDQFKEFIITNQKLILISKDKLFELIINFKIMGIFFLNYQCFFIGFSLVTMRNKFGSHLFYDQLVTKFVTKLVGTGLVTTLVIKVNDQNLNKHLNSLRYHFIFYFNYGLFTLTE
ncbi:hypothetical protein BpHYR1_033462 [Brachionus plicatilis]|uniref:Uncharacterized protein n=1 Tax=Brachionus plicatilis TaxID=10195 RepID=A0A3M7STR1_BRAPC|nr:hypothetical protein BpHYR1_033462 [Brachionus plicatilis]